MHYISIISNDLREIPKKVFYVCLKTYCRQQCVRDIEKIKVYVLTNRLCVLFHVVSIFLIGHFYKTCCFSGLRIKICENGC